MNNPLKQIYAEQYLEVCSVDNGTWNVELVIENINKPGKERMETLRHCLGNFPTMEAGDEFASAMRFYYDKSIFSYELM